MKKDNIFILFIGILSFALGFGFILKTWDGKKTARIYERGRLVANAKSPVKKPLLVNEKVIHPKNIISSLKVVEDQETHTIGILFGNYISEYDQSLCSAFDTIEVVLYGDNVAVSGKPPRMILTGDCPKGSQSDIESLSLQLEASFPVFRISDCKENVSLPDNYELENGTVVLMTNMDFGISEPDWMIEKVSFFDKDKDHSENVIKFDHLQIKEIRQDAKSDLNNGFIRIKCDVLEVE